MTICEKDYRQSDDTAVQDKDTLIWNGNADQIVNDIDTLGYKDVIYEEKEKRTEPEIFRERQPG